MIQTPSPSILEQLLDLVGHAMTPELARELIALRLTPEIQARIDDLAEKCNQGELSPQEHSDYQEYVQAIHLIGILQKKARKVLPDGTNL